MVKRLSVIKGQEEAVSEIIGALLLISVVMIGLSLISVLLFSTPPPESIPKVNLNGYCCKGPTSLNIQISHESGDNLMGYQLLFYLNDQNYQSVYYYSPGMTLSNDTIKLPFNTSTYLTPGSTLKLQVPFSPSNQNLIIYYTRDGKTKTKQLANFTLDCSDVCP
jgi:hypothetical protein